MQQIFVLSPIGKKGSDLYKKYNAILESMIRPAIEEIDKCYKIIRADQISQPGSFIKDILENLQKSFIVIANLTDLNPNVFYELGVRHTLTNRTIMITEDISSLPSDLKEYRVIEYSAELTGVETFKADLKKAFLEILKNPDKSDNPVQDRLPGILDKREEDYLKEIKLLRQRLENNKKGKSILKENIERRVERILKLIDAGKPSMSISRISWVTSQGKPEEKTTYVNPPTGNFQYYFVHFNSEDTHIDYSLVISIRPYDFDLGNELADIRVMLRDYKNKGNMKFKFVIATSGNFNSKIPKVNTFFKRALKLEGLTHKNYEIEVWDERKIAKLEKSLGLK
ncbi:MAG: hypothetical protein K1X86_10050 [Ignavibacteria bacterium]|nr:hypothetical protein [Ignavibacteria bacterium]